MNEILWTIDSYRFHRAKTLGLLNKIAEEQGDQIQQVLSWRPGPGRAHLGWQFMHIGVTEELFACDRLAEKPGRWPELWADFRGGSTPADAAPPLELIRQVLDGGREELEQTLGEQQQTDLDAIPPRWNTYGLSLRKILTLIGWHEAHHQGQAHITYNLYRASKV